MDKLRYSIFLKIYAGLLLVCASMGLLAYFVIQGVNAYRIDKYRETMASGAFYIIAQGVARQPDKESTQGWLDEASLLLNQSLSVIPKDKVTFDHYEAQQIAAGLSVVRYQSNVKSNNQSGLESDPFADVYTSIPHHDGLLYARVDRVSEQQIRALGVFFLDDLTHYEGKEQARLDELNAHLPFRLSLKNFSDVNLDDDQRARLRRKEVVPVYRDTGTSRNPTLRIVGPINTAAGSQVLDIGPIGLFNPLPFRLLILITFMCLVLILLGVYALILPLERKLRMVQQGVSQVRAGDFSARVPVNGQDEVSHLAMTFNNMTEHIQRLIEAQRELTRAVSHELRTPVARIRFGVDMLADTDDVDSRWDQQEMIDKDIEELNQLIDEILTYATLEQGTPSLNLESIALYDIVRQVGEETRKLGKSTIIEVREPDADVFAISERRYLHRVVQNFAGNAMRYANSKIRISAGVEGKGDKKYAYVCVEDDGAGIPEKDRDKVFQPFTRLDDSRTRASGGYGLGLSIVARIAFWFGGTVAVDQSPDLKGARFTMKWPVKPK
ncbi:MAG: HAMP domain-containing protein [Candidatus Saccharibacteria bacterium]|nr:HAMP domain-containing protein [Moraxellaceae bacterium]